MQVICLLLHPCEVFHYSVALNGRNVLENPGLADRLDLIDREGVAAALEDDGHASSASLRASSNR